MLHRVLIAVDDPVLSHTLVEAASAVDTSIVALEGSQRIWPKLARNDADLVLVHHRLVPPPVIESIRFLRSAPDCPDIVVVVDDDRTEERARLRAAGCEATITGALGIEVLRDLLQTILARRRSASTIRLQPAPMGEPRLSDFVSNSPAMLAFMQVVRRVVSTESSLLILGETGVGKERLARAIHEESLRRGAPFVAVNCGAIPESLLESELFGHEEGAFTGATRGRRGWFELAHGGTLFLDEIGDMPLHLQVKLLRALQEREIQPLGSERTTRIDVRVMAASNRDLEQAVEQKEFRRDLYYRLGVITLTIPALRDRREDIPMLAESYIAHFRASIGRNVVDIDPRALSALVAYYWPGNVRELMNVIERAVLLCDGGVIQLGNLPGSVARQETPSLAVQAGGTTTPPHPAGALTGAPDEILELPWQEARRAALHRFERDYLHALLERTGGRIGPAAGIAGFDPRSLREKMRRHGLRKEDFRG